MRVEVEFGGRKLYAGIVYRITSDQPPFRTKPILAVLDEQAVINPTTLQFWKWLADYYCCTMGEVMEAAFPAYLKLTSERRLVLDANFDPNEPGLDDKEYLIAEALQIQESITVDDVRKILNQKTVMPLIKRMMEKGIVSIYEELQEKYKPKKVACVRLAEPYRSTPDLLSEAFDLCARAPRQTETLMAFIAISKALKQPLDSTKGLLRQQVYDKASADSSILRAMEKKGIFELFERSVSRVGGEERDLDDMKTLAPLQEEALVEIEKAFEEKQVVLLHGVTGSGKTRLYVELVNKAIAEGKQVLYLLPEVALTTQVVERLRKIFGNKIAVYHHRVSQQERVELWQLVLDAGTSPSANQVSGQAPAAGSIVLGARSALFLPFSKLGLVIVDEEHDSSYKQQDPAPRYHGRDAAIYLAHLHGAKVLLGTATPAIESYYNARKGKYGLVELNERFGGVAMPDIQLVDLRKEARERKLQSYFSSVLLDELKAALERGEQAILFKNRRGYAPTIRCASCGWHAECIHCDVSLTYHKHQNNLRCHYCGYSTPVPVACPACGNNELKLQGYGTQKVEDELKIYLPDARIARMDYDAVKTKDAHQRIINDFEERRVDILVGTQMVTKGLDFENVGVVGVLSADHILQFPDFRSAERGFQLIVQVAGRAGRKDKQGKVIVQAMNVTHPVLREILEHDFKAFYEREIMERKAFAYPPFARLIKVTLKHKKPDILNRGARAFTTYLRKNLGNRVLGPAVPPVGRVRNFFLLDLLIKLERKPSLWAEAKEHIRKATYHMQKEAGFSNVRVNVDVDPV
ncbi:MAG: primosomal protein N' [Saprospirales bacterium]|nr:primosomal protein N' [Saprospirales bacterium]